MINNNYTFLTVPKTTIVLRQMRKQLLELNYTVYHNIKIFLNFTNNYEIYYKFFKK